MNFSGEWSTLQLDFIKRDWHDNVQTNGCVQRQVIIKIKITDTDMLHDIYWYTSLWFYICMCVFFKKKICAYSQLLINLTFQYFSCPVIESAGNKTLSYITIFIQSLAQEHKIFWRKWKCGREIEWRNRERIKERGNDRKLWKITRIWYMYI